MPRHERIVFEVQSATQQQYCHPEQAEHSPAEKVPAQRLS